MMPSSDGLNISVIIPVYNGGTNFRKCLASVNKAVPPPYEIVVVSDGDTDGSWRLAEASGAQVIRLTGPGGPARARNVGAETAKGDIFFFTDADVAIPPDSIKQIRDAFHREPELDALFGSYDDEPAEIHFLSQYKNLLHHYVHQTAREEASTFWGACGAIRCHVFRKMGGFNESYRRPSIEDIELGYRLKQAGHRIRIVKTLQVKHLKHWGLVTLLRSDFFDRALPWTRLILRDRRFISDLNLRYSSRLSVIIIYGLLGALIGVVQWEGFLVIAGALILLLLLINAPLYRFFRQKRGLFFTIRVIPFHWGYYLYSGLAFAIGLVGYIRKIITRMSDIQAPNKADK